MLQEAIAAISELAIHGRMPRQVELKGEPSHVYAIALTNGSIELRTATPPPRNHTVCGIDSLKALAEDHAHAAFWYSRTGVVLLFDTATRRDRASLVLRVHPQMAKLKELEHSKQAFDQKAFLSLLRIQFAGCDISEELVENLRHLKFKKKEENEISLQPSKASLGRSIQTELMGVKDFPDRITLRVAAFDGLYGDTYSIGCAIEIDPAKEAFQLIPFPGQIERAFLKAECDLMEMLDNDDNIPIYYGTP